MSKVRALLLTALVSTGLAASAGVPTWATRPTVGADPVIAEFGGPTCGPAGMTATTLSVGATERAGAWIKIERRRGHQTRPVVTPEGLPKTLRFRVREGRPIAVTVYAGRDVVASAQFAGYPC